METDDVRIGIRVLLIAGLAFGLLGGCQSHPCREPRLPELDQTGAARPVVAPPTGATNGSKISGAENTPLHLRVFKTDGSRQCDKRSGIALDVMERELAGIPVYAKEKRADGLMHIQVCGSPTGMINLFEIDQTNLKQAEERGFRRGEGE